MGQVKPASSRSSKTRRRPRQVGLACGAVSLQSGRRYAKRNRRLFPLLWPQGAHRPVLTARFPLQGALQTLPVTGREPDTQRSPQTTPPRELLTPAGTSAVSGGLLVATASGHLCWPLLSVQPSQEGHKGSAGILKVWMETACKSGALASGPGSPL